MDTYDAEIAPPGGSPELPGSEKPKQKKSGSAGDCKTRLIIVAVAVALVSVGVTGLLTSKKEVAPQSCDEKIETLAKQAMSDKESMKAKLDELKEELAAAERAAMGLPAFEGGEDITRFEGAESALYVNKQYRFALPIQEQVEIEAAKCDSDASGEPKLTSGQVPAIVLGDDVLKTFYVVPGYHYEVIDENETTGCRKVAHDLDWVRENVTGISLAIAELTEVDAVRSHLRENHGEQCADLAEFITVSGNGDAPLMYHVVLPRADADGTAIDCTNGQAMIDMWYSPVSNMLFTVDPIGSELDQNIQYPKQLLAL